MCNVSSRDFQDRRDVSGATSIRPNDIILDIDVLDTLKVERTRPTIDGIVVNVQSTVTLTII